MKTAPGVASHVGGGQRRVRPWAVATAFAGVATATALFSVSPETPGIYPLCPTYAITGWYCPGCGSLRATAALLHGDLALAWQRNPLLVILAAVAPFAVAAALRRWWVGAPRTLGPAWRIYALFAVILAYGILRNVPGWTWLSPQ